MNGWQLVLGYPIYICHVCSQEFSTRTTLLNHFSQCQIKPSPKQCPTTLPQLTRLHLDILLCKNNFTSLTYSFSSFFLFLVVKLQPISTKTFSPPRPSIEINDCQLPLSYLYSHGYLSTSTHQLSFDDSYCTHDHCQEDCTTCDTTIDEHSSNNNHRLSSYHIYKYSRRERDFYSSRLRRKKLISPTMTHAKSHPNDRILSVVDSKHYLIHIPTKITNRQRICSDSNQIYPLLFSPNFHTLVKLPPDHRSLENYSVQIRISFHLLNSIASQEFQTIVQNYDQQKQQNEFT